MTTALHRAVALAAFFAVALALLLLVVSAAAVVSAGAAHADGPNLPAQSPPSASNLRISSLAFGFGFRRKPGKATMAVPRQVGNSSSQRAGRQSVFDPGSEYLF